MNIKTYLINLDDSTDRLEQASQELKKANILFERISAFDGRNINPKKIKNYSDKAAVSYMGRSLNGGEIGCYYSHVNCVTHFLTTNADYAIILEDDMTCSKNIFQIINKTLTFLEKQKADWFLLNIGAHNPKIVSPIKKMDNHTLYHSHYFPIRATGLIWSRKGASEFLIDYQKNKIFCPVDNYYRHWLRNNKGLSIYPPLTPASGVKSNIDQSHKKREDESRHLLYLLIKQKRLFIDKTKAIKNKYFSSMQQI